MIQFQEAFRLFRRYYQFKRCKYKTTIPLCILSNFINYFNYFFPNMIVTYYEQKKRRKKMHFILYAKGGRKHIEKKYILPYTI